MIKTKKHVTTKPMVFQNDVPTVSVIMPVYNAGRFLRDAVQSVFSQTYTDWELIIVDDGSTDGSVEALDCLGDPRIVLLRQKNAGKPAAMNRALKHARGEFYALQDADDLCAPTRLERQLAYLLANPSVAGVFSGCEIILGRKRVGPTFRARSPQECAEIIAQGRIPAHDPTGMYRMSLVKDILYAEDLPSVEGIDYILRVGEQHPLAVLGECLYSYRWHDASVTKMQSARRDVLLETVFDRMAARRGTYASRAKSRGRQRAQDELSEVLSTSVADLLAVGRRLDAIKTGLAGVVWGSTFLHRWKPLAYALTPTPVMALYLRTKRWR